MRLSSRRLRWRHRSVLLAAAVAVAVLVAAGLARTQSASRGEPRLPGPARASAAETHIGARQGSAVELVAAGPAGRSPAGRDPSAVSSAEQRFALALLRHLGGPDVSVSPASLALALAMLENGARGRTRAEISTALDAGAVPPADYAAGWAALVRAWSDAARAGGARLSSANSLWTQRGLPIQPEFLSVLHRWFGAGVWQADFAHDTAGALDAINAWTSRHTNRRIPKLFDKLSADTSAVLANAIYFRAAWQQPFDPSGTHDAPFTTPDGPVTTSFMARTATLSAAIDPDYTAVQLPYRGNRFAALAVMPTSATLADFIAGLSATRLQRIVAGLHPSRTALSMPRFTTTATLDLGGALSALGMRTAFSDRADFSGLSPRPLRVSQVVQRVFLAVAEKGTEAAAATGTVLVPTSAVEPGQAIDLDHPFLFLVRDTATGAILFASEVNHPSD